MSRPTLARALCEQHEAELIRQAELIRDWPTGREQIEQAEIHVRLALWEHGLGRISQATQYRVYSILNFVMPTDSAITKAPSPLDVLQQEAAWIAAYYEQLDRQSCPKCGDGLCPIED